MKNELNDLVQEIVNFSNVMSFTDGTDDSDFQNACNLFGSYLQDRFTNIQTKPTPISSNHDLIWTVNEISQLSELISLVDYSNTPSTQWASNLFQHCEQLQRNKIAAA